MSRQYGTRCGFVIPSLITRKRLKMHGIATARQHERTREAELRMIALVAPSLIPEFNGKVFYNEEPGAEFRAVYPWIELGVA